MQHLVKSGKLDTILSKFWQLSKSSGFDANSAGGTTVTAGGNNNNRVSSALSREAKLNVLSEGEYFVLLVLVQVSIFVVDPSQLYLGDRFKVFKVNWQAFARKQIHGFTFKDFESDVLSMFNE